jgi:membrane protein DedA with SNARE-associated domain
MDFVSDLIQQVIQYIESVDPIVAYLLLMFASITENILPPFPGDMMTIFGASLVGTGKLSFAGVFIATTLGSTIGFLVYYVVGYYFGEAFIHGRFARLFPEEAMFRVQKWFDKYGIKMIVANRFLAGARAVVSILSGMGKFSVPKVILYSTISAILWNIILISAGAYVGKNWEIIVEYVQQYAKIISIFIAIYIVFIIVKKKLKK